MTLDILTSCNGHISKIESLLDALAVQTVLPDRILILLYTAITKDEHDMFLYYLQRRYGEHFFSKIITFSHLNSDHVPGNGHGYDRSFLLQKAKSDFSFLIDNDNTFGEQMVEDLLGWSMRLSKTLARGVIVSPTVMRRKSGNIQSQGMAGFRYWLPKYTQIRMDAQNWQEVCMIGGNSLLGPTKLLQAIGFDERFAYSYEDIDFSYRCWRSGYPIVVLNKVETYHMEREKNALQKMFIGDEKTAWYRARNRILFVKKNATVRQKMQYFLIGLWLQTIWFLVNIAVRAESFAERKKLWKAVISGTKEGLRSN